MAEVISFRTKLSLSDKEQADEDLSDALALNAEQIQTIAILNDMAEQVAAGQLNCVTMLGQNPITNSIFTFSGIYTADVNFPTIMAQIGMMEGMKMELLDFAMSQGEKIAGTDIRTMILKEMADLTSDDEPDGGA